MGIGKPKHAPIDIDGLTDETGTDKQSKPEKSTADRRMEELRASETALRAAEKSLEKATAALNDAVDVLDAAQATAGTIAAGFNKTVAEARENTELKVSIGREDLEQMMRLTQAALEAEEKLMEQHRAKQLQNLKDHERRISEILDRNQGVWFSHFWMKVFAIVVLACSLLTILYVLIKT